MNATDEQDDGDSGPGLLTDDERAALINHHLKEALSVGICILALCAKENAEPPPLLNGLLQRIATISALFRGANPDGTGGPDIPRTN